MVTCQPINTALETATRLQQLRQVLLPRAYLRSTLQGEVVATLEDNEDGTADVAIHALSKHTNTDTGKVTFSEYGVENEAKGKDAVVRQPIVVQRTCSTTILFHLHVCQLCGSSYSPLSGLCLVVRCILWCGAFAVLGIITIDTGKVRAFHHVRYFQPCWQWTKSLLSI